MTEALISFQEKYQKKQGEGKLVCAGLDPDLSHKNFPSHLKDLYSNDYARTREFILPIIDTTADLVCAFKPNVAFYAQARNTEEALEDIVHHIRREHPDVLIIGDLKRADIGNTNKGYGVEAFERYGVDAVTVNPYFGHDTYDPFYKYPGKGLIVLCKTTNPGAALYQDAPVNIYQYQREQILKGSPMTDDEMDLAQIAAKQHYSTTLLEQLNREQDQKSPLTDAQKQFLAENKPTDRTLPMYQIVALRTATLAAKHPEMAFGLVVGATHPEAFEPVRLLAPNLLFLIPGIGKQGGDLEATLRFAGNNIVINSSSGIIFASGGVDFAEAARAEVIRLDNQIRRLKAV